jgi:hypothetical protein
MVFLRAEDRDMAPLEGGRIVAWMKEVTDERSNKRDDYLSVITYTVESSRHLF